MITISHLWTMGVDMDTNSQKGAAHPIKTITTNWPTITDTNKSFVNGKNREKPTSTQRPSSHPIQDLGSRTEKPTNNKKKKN